MKVAVIIKSIQDLQYFAQSRDDNLILEFRIDQEPDLLEKVDNFGNEKEIILTLRSENEGGNYSGVRDTYLNTMIEKDVKYIDLELKTDLDQLKNIRSATPVLSRHDYTQPMVQTISKFIKNFSDSHNSDDYVIKFVGDPVDSYDMLKSLQLAKSYFKRSVILGIGNHGIMSRTFASGFNQEFVFGATSHGVIPHIEEVLVANEDQAVRTGLIGQYLSHSLSPKIHHLFFNSQNRAGYYHLFEVHQTEKVVKMLKMLGDTSIKGLNVTFPYKKALATIGEQDKWVKLSGVTNTLHFEDDGIHAYNTDITGFQQFYSTLDYGKSQSVTIIGAGGAARAVSLALLDLGIDDITIINRSAERFSHFPDKLRSSIDFQLLERGMRHKGEVYINATTLGYNNELVTDIFDLSDSTELVIDLNYSSEKTPLIIEAEKKGVEAHDGKSMLFHQAADAYEIWTNDTLDRETLFQQFQEGLNEN